MQRNFIRGFLICLIPCLLAAYFAFRGPYKLGIDLAGGTILVYEINLERTQERQKTQAGAGGAAPSSTGDAKGLSSEEMQRLAAAIKRRIDGNDLKNITVRPMGSSRLEIILPRMSVGEIEEIKSLIRQVGVLEFRILANNTDDKEGVREAESIIRNLPEAEAKTLAEKGLPPPSPPGEFEVMGQKVRYQWVELRQEERQSLGLSNSSEGTPLWQALAARRGSTFLNEQNQVGERRDKTGSMLLFSRDHVSEEGLRKEAEDQARLGADSKPKKVEYFVLTRVSPYDTVKIAGDVTLSARAETDQNGNPAVSFTFNGAGGRLFGQMTERNKPDNQTNTVRYLAIVLDDKVVSAPSLNGRIENQGQITGKFDLATVNNLVTILRSGALTAELRDRPVSESTIGATLGQDTIDKGVRSVGFAFLIVLAFMLVYYRFAGMVACVALLANLLLTIGFMVAVNAAFTLPGLAGMVLMLGMAVDANVLIYERLREERNKGANLATAIRNGYDRAFLTIIDTHLTSIFTSIVLYTFGNDQLKGFAISLAVGLLISLFTSLYMTRLMFDFWLKKGWLTELKMMRLFERPSFDFMKIRYYMFATTATLTVLGLALFLYRGEKSLNVDFTSGAVYGGKLRDGEEKNLTELRDLLSKPNQDQKLQVKEVRWLNEPVLTADEAKDPNATAKKLNEYIYDITYLPISAGGKEEHALVSFSAPSEGTTKEQMADDIKTRASHLPDSSVEQVFLNNESYPDRKSKHFTIRTTEKESELVQVVLDRLLRDDKGQPLMASAKMTYGAVTGPRMKLVFSEETSPNYLSRLLERSFRLAGALADVGGKTFSLTNEKGEDLSTAGKYREMFLDVSNNQKFSTLAEQAKTASDQETRTSVLTSAGALLGGFASTEMSAAPAAAKPEAAAEIKTLEDILKQTQDTFDSRPIPERLETFDSQLAAETRTKAFIAILISWVAIILYLWFRFGNWTFGTAAVLCLIHDLCFTLGAIAACHYLAGLPFMHFLGIEDFKIDLAAVAALLTLVGYSVNEIIVNFARIREVRGKSPVLTPQMINDSVNQTLSRTVLTSATVFLVSMVLFLFGGEGIHLFAFVMVMGVMISTYSSIFVASPLLLLFGEGTAATPRSALSRKEEASVP